jgi:hypothetical protein
MVNEYRSSVSESDHVAPRRPRRARFRMRSLMIFVALAALCASVLGNAEIAPVVLLFLGLFAVALTVMGVAMGLGLLGFGFVAAGDQVIGWLRRAVRWPDE